MSYRYTVPELLDRLLEDLFEDNYETYEDGYVLPLVLGEDAPRMEAPGYLRDPNYRHDTLPCYLPRHV